MKHLDLFSGIGGFALSARWMGWETVQFVEVDKFCQQVLQKNFPNVPIHGDIKTFDGTKFRGTVDIVTGGFPCQPFSNAGKRKGKDDDRYLWPEMLRVIGEVKPRWIVGENVTGIIGMALDQVLASLEDQGYHTETYIIPACAVNAPHRRDRVWIVAHSNEFISRTRRAESTRQFGQARASEGSDGSSINPIGESNGRHDTRESEGIGMDLERNVMDSAGWVKGTNNVESSNSDVTNPENIGCERTWDSRAGRNGFTDNIIGWQDFPTQPPLRSRDDGIPSGMVRSAIQAAGNAIVPQIAFEIFKAIESI